MTNLFNNKDINGQRLFQKMILEVIFNKTKLYAKITCNSGDVYSDIEIIYNLVVIQFYNYIIIIFFFQI